MRKGAWINPHPPFLTLVQLPRFPFCPSLLISRHLSPHEVSLLAVSLHYELAQAVFDAHPSLALVYSRPQLWRRPVDFLHWDHLTPPDLSLPPIQQVLLPFQLSTVSRSSAWRTCVIWFMVLLGNGGCQKGRRVFLLLHPWRSLSIPMEKVKNIVGRVSLDGSFWAVL